MVPLLIKFAVRLVLFAGVLFLATRKSEDVEVSNRAIPLVALIFAALNTCFYWLLAPLLNLATLGLGFWVVPFIVNGLFLYGTAKVSRGRLEINSIRAGLMLVGLLTVANFAVRLGLGFVL